VDPSRAFLPALGDDVRGAEFAGQRLARRMAAHADDALGSHLARGEDRKQTNRAVADDGDRRARFTLAASAANHPVPKTSEVASILGTRSSGGTSVVATKVRPRAERVK
jgi:uncharacterized protein (UPF0261 family)